MKRILAGGTGLLAAALALHGSWTGAARAAGSDDRSVAESALAEVAASSLHPVSDGGAMLVADLKLADAAAATAGDAGPDPALTRGPVREAERALERARGARGAGDVQHAQLLEGLAREWAETARDLARASVLEQEATTLEARAAETATRAERARALLEEDVARRGRAEAELARVAGGGSPFPSPATSAALRGGNARAPQPASSASQRGSR